MSGEASSRPMPGPSAAAALLLVAGPGSPALAADDPDMVELQPVVVTGSRITRPDFASASPVVTVPPEAFEQTGAPTLEAALNRYPQFVPTLTSTSNNPGMDGQAQLNLRGLGTVSTLVLLDGRRLVPANGLGVPDVNLIPPALIERVEIITGGASAVYGSDAIAGVVNFMLRESFEGLELGGFYGHTDRGDGEQWDLRLTAGTNFAGGRGTVYGAFSRAERRLVTHGDRDFSRDALRFVGAGAGTLGPGDAFIPGGNPVIAEGRAVLPVSGANPIDSAAFQALFESYGYPAGTVPVQTNFGFNQDGTLFTQGNLAPGSVANFRGVQDPLLLNDRAYGYNTAPEEALQLPLERDSGFGRLHFELSEQVRLHAQVIFADFDAIQRLAPAPVDSLLMPPDNPFIPEDLAFLLASRPLPEAPFRWDKRLAELGPRIVRNRYRVRQGTIGLEGYFASGWRFDAYLQQGENRSTSRQWGTALRSRMEELTFASDGGLAACGGFDVFGLGSIPAACAQFIAVDAANESHARQYLAEASIEGPLLDLPAGELRTAFGIFHKRDEFSYAADPIASVFLPDGRPDIAGFNASDDVDGEESNTDLYFEALVPLLADRPGVAVLETGLGYRHAEYDAAGGADAWKLELLYRPIRALRIRGSYQKAVRAPSVSELFEPQLPDVFDLTQFGGDPCAANSVARSGPHAAAVEALCLSQGLPPDLLETFQPAFPIAFGFQGGNEMLRREQGETWTAGLAWSPTGAKPHLGRVQFALDVYRIELEDAIFFVPAGGVISLCFDPAVNAGLSPDFHWCQFFARDPGTGEIVDALQTLHNAGRLEQSGIDLQLDWSRPLGPGTAGLNWLVSRLLKFEVNEGQGAPTEQLDGMVGGQPGNSFPEWKSLLSLNYGWRGLTLTARTRYIHDMKFFFAPEFHVPSRTYIDLHASYDFGTGALNGLRLGLGIENVSDRDPPIVPFGPANTNPQQYDVLGRRYFASLSYRF